MERTVDITPSPRVLRMLGQIDFRPWQCLAELIDNSIDSFIDQVRLGTIGDSPRIKIQLPTSDIENGEVVVIDNGSGMTFESLQNAVRAGYSGNDPVEKMGLFGMGFNISTARLGRRTEVWTTTADSSEWIGVVIDFDQLEKKATFKTPVLTREKSDYELEIKHHGTEVHVTKLETDRLRPLIYGAGIGKTRKKLGKIYGRVMTELGISIFYSGVKIQPWTHCIWDKKRSVPTKDFGNVPAVIEIDEELDPREFCTTCWFWLNENESTCPSCGSSDHLIIRKRRLKGWIGVQRYFDKEHFGIDLIRNGRVIEELDKSLFYFENENSEKEKEYPIDATHWGGRIVGELEIDFVRVSHQKDAFDKLDPEWKHVIELVRGTSPLRPQIAQRKGLPQNISHLARLYAGYRSGHAGLKELVPGDKNGTGMNSGVIQEYIKRFYNNEEEYQTDEKWYELVVQAENAKRGGSEESREAGGEYPIASTENGNADSEQENEKEIKPDESESKKRSEAEKWEIDKALTRSYELDLSDYPFTISTTVKRYFGASKSDNYESQPYKIQGSGFVFNYQYYVNDPIFEQSLDTPLDYFLIDLANHFSEISTQSPENLPVSFIENELRKKYFPETLTDVNSVVDMAQSLISELRVFIDENIQKKTPISIEFIDENMKEKIIKRAIQDEPISRDDLDDLIKQGKFVQYIDEDLLVDMFCVWPDLFLDGHFFINNYLGINEELQKQVVERISALLKDILWLLGSGRNTISHDNSWRLNYAKSVASMRLLMSWRIN